MKVFLMYDHDFDLQHKLLENERELTQVSLLDTAQLN